MFLSGKLFYCRIFAFVLPFAIALNPTCIAQATENPSHNNEVAPGERPLSVPADILHIQTGQQSIQFTTTTFRELPHTTIKVHNTHSNKDESYSGVPLNLLLGRVGTPLGKELHGKALADYLLIEGADHYQAVLSLAEADPTFHPGDILVVDSQDGKPLEKDGHFKLIVSEDKRPARWVRNLIWIRMEATASR
jgi:hypothetical protein